MGTQDERPERTRTGVADLVRVAPPDQHERPLPQLDPVAVHDGLAGAGNDVEPLVRAAVAVVRPAVRLAGPERHLRGLAVLVAQHDPEPVAELQVLVLHGNLRHFAGRRTTSGAKSLPSFAASLTGPIAAFAVSASTRFLGLSGSRTQNVTSWPASAHRRPRTLPTLSMPMTAMRMASLTSLGGLVQFAASGVPGSRTLVTRPRPPPARLL
jgi:hypothetical protein